MKTIKSISYKSCTRFFYCFLGFGILCGILIPLSLITKSDFFIKFGPWIRLLPIPLVCIYSLFFLIIMDVFSDTDLLLELFLQIGSCVIGCFAGGLAVLAFLFGKWLIHHPILCFGIIVILVILTVTVGIKKDKQRLLIKDPPIKKIIKLLNK